MTTVLQRFHGLTAREWFCRIGRTDRWIGAHRLRCRSAGCDKAALGRLIKAQGQSPRRPQADRLHLVWLDRRRFGRALQPQIDGQNPSNRPATGQQRRGVGHPSASSRELPVLPSGRPGGTHGGTRARRAAAPSGHPRRDEKCMSYRPPLRQQGRPFLCNSGVPCSTSFNQCWQAVVRTSAIADTRFTLMVDSAQGMLVTGFTVSQVSAMAVNPPVLFTPALRAGVDNTAPEAMLG